MEWFEKEYKKRFENESSLDGIESGPLWDEISKSIPQDESDKIPYWKWTLFIVAIIGLVASFLIFQNKEIENQKYSSESDEASSVETKTEEKVDAKNQILTLDNNTDSNENTSNASETFVKNVESIQIDQQAINTNQSDIISSNGRTEETKRKGFDLDLKPNNEARNNSIISESSTNNSTTSNNLKINIEENPLIIEPKNATVHDSEAKSQLLQIASESQSENTVMIADNTMLSKSDSRIISDINLLAIHRKSLSTEREEIKMPNVVPPIIIVNMENPWSINLNGSANFFNLKYEAGMNTEQFASQANDAIGPLQIGNSVGVNLEYQINRNWSVTSGIEFNNYENKLSTVLVSDTTVLDDQIIRNALNVRTVVHHNKLSTFSIPIGIAYDYKVSGNWSLGASVGVSYSIIKSQSGRLLGREENIIDYSNESNSQFDNFTSFRANPYIRYRVSDHTSLQFIMGLSYQNHGNSEVLDLKQSSTIYNFGIGLRYKL